MELKRYVLMNDNMIITDIRQCNYDDKKYEYVQSRSKEGVLFMRELMVKQVKKTSDNILDFVEVGDLIEIPQTIIKVDNVNNNGSFETLVSREYSKVTAIYKRQPNGDYKKYEVK